MLSDEETMFRAAVAEFAADEVAIDRLALEQENVLSRPRHDDRQRGSGEPATHDDDVAPCHRPDHLSGRQAALAAVA